MGLHQPEGPFLLFPVVPGVPTFQICQLNKLDVMAFILLLKSSAKSSQRAPLGILENLFKLVLVNWSRVQKRISRLLLWSLVSF